MRAPGPIAVNHENYRHLKRNYEAAVKKKRMTFYCFGNQLLTDYAKYYLEHMREQLKIKE